MGSESWRRVDEVYHAALERPIEERSAFVAQACQGDVALEREVRSLLDQESAAGFLSTPAIEVAARMVEPSTDAPWLGRRIGVYTLDAFVGKGGMGEVYRARDTRLGRDVAIKVLPRAFTDDPVRLARFEREARLLAALNHPHIGVIHGVEEAPGVLALVLEFVPGETLGDRVRSGPLPVRDALAIARQIADALDAAHDKGIVHRDLKPDNVKITPQGVVKVLDFGLAKTDVSGGDLAHSPTITAAGTDTGVILGTAAYMSPEQARGQAVDKRADVWAFGCVLYEMLTGRAAFAESTVQDTLASILRRDPDWDALPAGLPASVTTLLHRCLEKDLHRRKRELGDARAELDDAMISKSGPSPVAKPRPAARRAPYTVPLWAVALGAIVVTAAIATWVFWPRWQNPLGDAEFSQLTSFPGAEEGAAISPDGRWVAFMSDQHGPFHVFLTPIGPGGFTDLTPDDKDQHMSRAATPDVVFTGDGLQIMMSGTPRKTRRLQTLPLTAAGPRTPFLTDDSTMAVWSPDGRKVVYSNHDDGDTIALADLPNGANPVQIYKSEPGWHNHGLVWSTADSWVYFVHGVPDVEMDLWRVRPQKDSKPEALTHGLLISSIAPIDANTVLYTGRAADGAGPWLWAFDVKSKTSQRVSSGLEQYTSISASADGRTLAATRSSPSASLSRVPILDQDRVAEQSDVRPEDPQGVRALSPRVRNNAVYYLSTTGSADGLWRLQDGVRTEIWKGSQGALLEPPAISADGSHAAILVRRNGRRTLTIVPTDGSGTLQARAESLDVRGTADWSEDGKWLLVAGTLNPDKTPQAGIFKVPYDGSGPPLRLVPDHSARVKLSEPQWKPGDSSTIQFASDDLGGVMKLMEVRGGGEPADLGVLMNAVISNHRFLPDGKGVVFLSGLLRSPEFWLLDLATGKTRQLTRIGAQANLGQITGFDISADGKSIIFDRIVENSDIVLIKRPVR